jgi:HEAT repeat protein
MFSQDAELAGPLRATLEEWKGSVEPGLRLRAEVVTAHLDGTWEISASAHPDPFVRAGLLENPPGDDLHRPVVIQALLRAASSDIDPAVRMSALKGLPVELDLDHVILVADRLVQDPEVQVRLTAARVLGAVCSPQVKVVAALKQAAFSPTEDPEVQEAARSALLRTLQDHPGSMTPQEEEALVRAISGASTGSVQ